MPIIELQCMNCKYTIEKLQRNNETLEITCPKCNNNMEKILSASGGFILKGEGFYKRSE